MSFNGNVITNSGVAQPAALHPGHYSGAHDPISIGFYNVGFQNNFVALFNQETGWSTPAHCYKFTMALEKDLSKAFGPKIGLDALFLCELGSMEKEKSIDKVFSQRTQLHSDVSQPAALPYCDRVVTLADYLDMMLQPLSMEDFTVSCHPPYACIFQPDILQLHSAKRISELTQDTQRFAYAYELTQISTRLDFRAVCCHSPMSKKWDNLTTLRKEGIFKALAGHAGASTHNRALCRWIVGGDLNTTEGLLNKWAAEYWEPVIGSAANDLGLRPTITRSHRNSTCLHGDFASSQGILTTHVESTVGKSMQQHDQTYASDAHDLFLVHGWLADEPSSGVLPPAARPVEHIGSPVTQDSHAQQAQRKLNVTMHNIMIGDSSNGVCPPAAHNNWELRPTAGQDLLPRSGVFPPAASR